MNGYDPLLARFGTPDPMTENSFFTQGWNRYSYVGNSPLNFTDPSGYCFLGCFWQKAFKAVQKLFRQVPILGAIVQIAAGFLCGHPCAVLTSAFVAGVTSGDLGMALKAGLISAVTAGAFKAVGDFTASGSLGNVAGHAAVGCLSAVASGGRCGSGALSAGIPAAGTPFISQAFPNARTDAGDMFGGTAASAVLGGLGSVAGGGKFENGAVSGLGRPRPAIEGCRPPRRYWPRARPIERRHATE